MILEGGRIYTGDRALPRVHALPIDDRGRVSRGVEAWEGDTSAVSNERVDLAGRTVLPGLRDAGGAFVERALREAFGGRQPAELLAAAQRSAHQVGLVAITDTSPGPGALLLWQHLDRDERTTLRVTVGLDTARARAAADLGLQSGFGSDRVRIGAAVLDPRADVAADLAADLRARGLDLMLCTDDAASLAEALTCLPMTAAADTRDRIQVRATAPAPDRAEIPVVVIAGPGSQPAALSDLVANGHPLAVGSGEDAPSPLAWFAALRRAGADPQAALTALTATPAILDGGGARAGTLAPGAPADLVVLAGDPLEADPDAIADIGVVATMIAGRWVHGRPPW